MPLHRSRQLEIAACAIAALWLSACGRPEPAAPQAPPPAPARPPEPPSVLPLAPVPPILVQAVGFESPESVAHDVASDVYLVSNVAGGILDQDDNGFVSRLAPDGSLAQLRWIDGKGAEVTLNAPKGMALIADKLYIADIDVIRSFDRQSGKPLGQVSIPGATCLNDVAAAPDGMLYVSDSGLRKIQGLADPQKNSGDAIYAIDPQGVVSVLIKGPELGQPNGLLADNDGVFVAGMDGEVYRVSRTGMRSAVASVSSRGLDGLVRTDSGRLIVSSWEASTIFASKAAAAAVNSFDPLITELEAPADLGYDAKRRQLLVPLFKQNAIYMQQITGD